MASDTDSTNEILLFLTQNSDVIGTVSDILVPTLGLVVAGSVYLWNKKKDRLAYIQQSFDDLQLINQLILGDKENLRAAVSSIWPGKEIDKFEARKVYIHYVRINRLYRIWNYSEQNVISKKQARKVIKAHARVLKHHEDYLGIMLLLGYPEDFQKYLKDLMIDLDPIPDLFSEISGADTAKNIEISDDV